MRLRYWPLLLSTLAAADLSESLDNQLKGDDFEFEATYPSGLKLSTSDDDAKRGVLPFEEVTGLVPEIKVKGLDDVARKKRYIAFVVMSRIPTIELVDDVVWGLPWTGTNLTIAPNGTLYWGDEYVGGRTQTVDYAEVRNGSLHLWEHTQEINDVLTETLSDGSRMPSWFQIIRVWQNRTDVPPFKLANIDFKFQNTKGLKRCDVSVAGAPIPGVKVGDDESCDKTPTPEKTGNENGGKDDKGKGNDQSNSKDNDGKGGDSEGPGSMLSMNWPLASIVACCAAALAAF